MLEHSSVFITLALGIKSPASPNQDSSFLRGNFVTSVLAHIAAFFQFASHYSCQIPAGRERTMESGPVLEHITLFVFHNAIFQCTQYLSCLHC